MKNASSRAATLISCSTVDLIGLSVSRHVLGFVSGACRCFPPVHGAPRAQVSELSLTASRMSALSHSDPGSS
jgi:hypothetical protein